MIPVDVSYCDEVAATAERWRRLARLAMVCAVALALVGLARSEVSDIRVAGASPSRFVQHCHQSPDDLAWCEFVIWWATPGAAEYHAWATAPKPKIPALLRRIRGCESGNGPHHPGSYHITNGHGRSTSSGAYQFLDGTWARWRGESTAPRAYLASRAEQDAAAVRLFNAQGTRPWLASRGCWA